MRATCVALLVLVVACLACRPRERDDAVAAREPRTSEPPPPETDAGLPALTGAPWLDQLDLPEGMAASVSVPLGATEPRPIMVAAHGAGDRPEWACGSWRGVTNAYPFIICPRGTATGDGRYYWSSSEQLGRVVDRAVAALRTRYGPYVAEGPMVYAGFSAGAIYGSSLVRDRAAEFPVAIFAEGAYGQLADPSFGPRFKRNGGRRLVLACSTGGGCLGRFEAAAKLLERAGVEARLNDAGRIGHNLNDDVVRSLREALPWLVSDCPGWSARPAASTPEIRTADTLPRPDSPVQVVAMEVPGDLPAFFLRGAKGTTARIVFLSGACTHPAGYLQSFQFAAHERGSMLGVQGDVPCSGSYRRWTVDAARQNARITAALAATGESDGAGEIVLIGYSQGALLAEELARKYPARYPRVILIGDPVEPSLARLRAVYGAVMMAGDLDATEPMKRGARTLQAAGVPARYLEMPNARHGQMGDAERLMGEALDWLLSRRGPAAGEP